MNRVLFFWKQRKKNKLKGFSKLINASMPTKLARLLAILFLVIFIHTVAIHYFEGLSLSDSAWLSFTSITTVGYGDFSAKTVEGRVTTIILIYIVGIWLLAQLAGDFWISGLTNVKNDKRPVEVEGNVRSYTYYKHTFD